MSKCPDLFGVHHQVGIVEVLLGPPLNPVGWIPEGLSKVAHVRVELRWWGNDLQQTRAELRLESGGHAFSHFLDMVGVMGFSNHEYNKGVSYSGASLFNNSNLICWLLTEGPCVVFLKFPKQRTRRC